MEPVRKLGEHIIKGRDRFRLYTTLHAGYNLAAEHIVFLGTFVGLQELLGMMSEHSNSCTAHVKAHDFECWTVNALHGTMEVITHHDVTPSC